MLAGKDINLTGQNVTIESADNTYNAQEKHEYKKSGLTVAIGGTTVDAVQKITAPIERAGQVKDEKLAALYALNTAHDLQKNLNEIGKTLDNIEAKDESAAFKISIGIGSTSSKSHLDSETTLAKGSNVAAGGDVIVTATEKDINIKGSDVSGEDVSLAAKGDVNITSAKNTNTSSSDSKASSGSIGVSINTSGISDINAGYSKYKGEVKENGTTHTNSTVSSNKIIGKEISALVNQCMFFCN